MKDSCCHTPEPKKEGPSCCGSNNSKKKFDWLLWGSAAVCLISIVIYLSGISLEPKADTYFMNTTMLLQKMWWGLALGILFVGFLSQIPREFVMKILGDKRGLGGILRATLAGLLLDLCSHGILLVGTKLYERGASTAQMMAFLIASPWNSFSLTLILWALVGLKWTLAFIIFSAVIAIVTGLLFDLLETKGVIPSNSNRHDLPSDFKFFKEAKSSLSKTKFNLDFFKTVTISGLQDSKMILRWILFGSVLAAAVQTFVSTENLQHFFGPSVTGLLLTLVAATVIEVCSEGSTPIAADLLTRAHAPGNAFAFLMTGVSTDYTEIAAIREQTKSWKITLMLPLLSVPQIVFISWILNHSELFNKLFGN